MWQDIRPYGQHDYEIVVDKTADAIYAAICKAVGMGSIRVWTEHKALRLCGGSAWDSHGADDQTFARAHGELILDGMKRGDDNYATVVAA